MSVAARSRSPRSVRVAARLATERAGRIALLRVIVVPLELPLDADLAEELAEADRLLQALKAEMVPERRTELGRQLHRLLYDEQPYLFTSNRPALDAAKRRVHGLTSSLAWYELRREGGKPQWTQRLIDHDSGVGTQFEVTDVNRDGLLDVITSNKKGVYYFEQTR